MAPPWMLMLVLLAGMSAQAAQSFSLTPLWSIAPDTTYEWASTNHTQRSIAYNPATGHLLTVSRYPATNAAIYILDSNTGALLGQLDTNGVFLENSTSRSMSSPSRRMAWFTPAI